jgi:spore maturation protein CgeB
MRTFDIALTGTFQVSEKVYLSNKLFGDLIGFYDDDTDFARVVDYYLAHDVEREEKGVKSRAIALQWTYAEDAKRVLAACGVTS